MPAKAVTVTATYKASPPVTYAVNLQDDGNGKAEANVSSAAVGTEVRLTATPNDGYRFKQWQVVSGNVTIVDDGFVMPGEAVTIKAIFEPLPVEPEYIITGGANGSWNKGDENGMTITCNGDFTKFTGLKMDGDVLDRSNYTVVSGSTIVTLKPAYLKTLAAGNHTLEFVYTDGSITTSLTILSADNSESTVVSRNAKTPQTGDDNHLYLWLLLGVISMSALGGMIFINRKQSV